MSEYDLMLDRELEEWYAGQEEAPSPDPDDFDVKDLEAEHE